MAEHKLSRGFKGARTLVRDQQAMASAAIAALTRSADEARAATEVSAGLCFTFNALRRGVCCSAEPHWGTP